MYNLQSSWDLAMASASWASSDCCDLGDMGWLKLSRACSGSSDSLRKRVSVPVVPIMSTFFFKSIQHWKKIPEVFIKYKKLSHLYSFSKD